MFVDPYKSTIVLIMHTKYVLSKLHIWAFDSLFSFTSHSADKNIILRHDSNQYLSGKKIFPVAAYNNKQNIFCPNWQEILNVKNKTAKSDSNTSDIYKYCLLFVIYV